MSDRMVFLTGGVGGAGFAWYFAYLIFAYVLLGPRGGTVWSLALVGVTAAVVLAGVSAAPYPAPFMLDGLWAYVLSMSLVYILNRAYERSQQRVEQAAEERARAAEQARELEKLKALDELRNALLSTVSHELKTPLTPLTLQTEILESERMGPLNEKQRKAVVILRRNLERLGGLVQQTLDVARLQGGRMTLERRPTALAPILRDAVESFEESARTQNVGIALLDPPEDVVVVDAARLTQVMFDLLSNALRFTPPGGTITVLALTEADALRISVRDTGQGLLPEHMAHLFQPFARVEDAAQAKKEGTGLGLYISKGIVEAHGGAIGCASDGPGKGSVFWFTLPRAASS